MDMAKGKRVLMVSANGAETEAKNKSEVEEGSESMAPSKPSPKLDRGTQSRIGDQLRAMYTELMEQPVPDKFKALLDKLEDKKEGDR